SGAAGKVGCTGRHAGWLGEGARAGRMDCARKTGSGAETGSHEKLVSAAGVQSKSSLRGRRDLPSAAYQFVMDPSGRKNVCARLVSYFVTSKIGFRLLMSSSTRSPGRSFG